MSLWYQPPGGAAVQVNPSDILIVDQSGVTRSVSLDVLFASIIGIRGASSDDEQAQLFAKGVQSIIRLDLLGITTTTPAPTSSTTTTSTSTTTGAPGSPPASTIVFSNFNNNAVAPVSTINFSNFT